MCPGQTLDLTFGILVADNAKLLEGMNEKTERSLKLNEA